MKIDRVLVEPYRIRMTRPIGDANFPEGRHTVGGSIVTVETDDGHSGLALGASGIGGTVDGLTPALAGKDPRGVRGLWKMMADLLFKSDIVGVAGEALTAIDDALWDLKAKAAGEPLWRLLGGVQPRVRAYASGLDMPLDDAAVREFYEGKAAQGVTAGKLKVGRNRERDLERIAIMETALRQASPSPAIMVDANEYWSAKQAIRRVREIEERFPLVWVEEPARRWDHAGLRQVSDAVDAAVATGENLDHVWQYRALLAERGADVVEVGTNAGGITGALQVADLAYAHELPVAVMNSPGNYMAHVAAAIPNHLMMELVDAGRDAFFTTGIELRDGWLHLSERPGFGIEIDREALSAASDAAAGDDLLPAGRAPGAGLGDDGAG